MEMSRQDGVFALSPSQKLSQKPMFLGQLCLRLKYSETLNTKENPIYLVFDLSNRYI